MWVVIGYILLSSAKYDRSLIVTVFKKNCRTFYEVDFFFNLEGSRETLNLELSNLSAVQPVYLKMQLK
jgi:ribosomal silencing factor RsfS